MAAARADVTLTKEDGLQKEASSPWWNPAWQ